MTGLMRILTRRQMKHKCIAKGPPQCLIVKGRFLFAKIYANFQKIKKGFDL